MRLKININSCKHNAKATVLISIITFQLVYDIKGNALKLKLIEDVEYNLIVCIAFK